MMAPPNAAPRTVPVYRAARELATFLWKFQRDHGLTDTETLMVLMDIETHLVKHLVLGDPHPGEL